MHNYDTIVKSQKSSSKMKTRTHIQTMCKTRVIKKNPQTTRVIKKNPQTNRVIKKNPLTIYTSLMLTMSYSGQSVMSYNKQTYIHDIYHDKLISKLDINTPRNDKYHLN